MRFVMGVEKKLILILAGWVWRNI